jgi:hypothetical protein
MGRLVEWMMVKMMDIKHIRLTTDMCIWSWGVQKTPWVTASEWRGPDTSQTFMYE